MRLSTSLNVLSSKFSRISRRTSFRVDGVKLFRHICIRSIFSYGILHVVHVLRRESHCVNLFDVYNLCYVAFLLENGISLLSRHHSWLVRRWVNDACLTSIEIHFTGKRELLTSCARHTLKFRFAPIVFEARGVPFRSVPREALWKLRLSRILIYEVHNLVAGRGNVRKITTGNKSDGESDVSHREAYQISYASRYREIISYRKRYIFLFLRRKYQLNLICIIFKIVHIQTCVYKCHLYVSKVYKHNKKQREKVARRHLYGCYFIQSLKRFYSTSSTSPLIFFSN